MVPVELAHPPGGPPDLTSLQQAFEQFNQSAAVLEEQQSGLRARIAQLDVELAESHDELERSLSGQSRLANDLHNVLENLTVGVIAVDTEGRVQTISRRALDLLGLAAEDQIIGRHVTHTVGPVLGAPIIASLAHFAWTPERTFETRVVEGDGHRHLRVHGSAAHDVETGEPRGGVLVIEDITALVGWRERALLNERLSTMGQMAAQVAHEIRNPLGSIELMASALAEETGGESGHAAELASHIVSTVGTLDTLVSNILLFARGREPEAAPLVLEDMGRAALVQTHHALEQSDVRVECRWQACPMPALGDADLIVQAVVNLIINATQALRAGTGERVVSLETGSDAESVWLRVADSGPGVPEEMRARIFDPFVTTRRRGTGLGLAIVSHIVAAHGGRADCREAPEGGALFEIALPRADAAVHGGAREGTHG